MTTKKQILESLAGNSLAEEVDRDVNATARMLRRAPTAKAMGADKAIVEQEKRSADVYKRALVLIGASGTTATSPDGTTKSLAENGLPVSSYLSHGSRVMIQIPPNGGDKLFNWLTSGDTRKSGASRSQTQQEAIEEGKIVYNRSAATHGIDVIDTKDGLKEVRELKGFAIGAGDYFKNKVLGKDTQHWGVDLAMDAAFGGPDSEGNIVSHPDGDHGHLYIYYQPPTETHPGAILIGNEGGAPTSHKHSKLGKSDPLSPTGGSKWQDLHAKKEAAGELAFKDTIIPRKYNGLIARPTSDTLDKITSMTPDSIDKIGPEIAARMPSKTPEGFLEKEKTHLYELPAHMPSEKLKEPEKVSKPNWGKRIIHFLTGGKFFNQQIKDYKQYKLDKKKYMSAQKVISQDQNRRIARTALSKAKAAHAHEKPRKIAGKFTRETRRRKSTPRSSTRTHLR
ncbi:MAG: hypothetical protein HRU36_02185 [Rickettsiales bacterium]|nr:hypothetical protein [Rickettsiales bacterium]